MRQEQEREKAKLREMTEHEIEGYLWTFAVENWETFGWKSPPKLGIFPIRPKQKKFSFNLAGLHNSAKIHSCKKGILTLLFGRSHSFASGLYQG